jgi:hypothetical protein
MSVSTKRLQGGEGECKLVVQGRRHTRITDDLVQSVDDATNVALCVVNIPH